MSALLSAYRIPVVPLTLAPDIDAGRRRRVAADRGGQTVALKVVSPDIVHKSDIGGVHLDLTSEADVREAARSILTRRGGSGRMPASPASPCSRWCAGAAAGS